MNDPYVRMMGKIEDPAVALPLEVGVDYDTVTIGCGAIRWHLTAAMAEEFAQLFSRARWEAAAQGWAAVNGGSS